MLSGSKKRHRKRRCGSGGKGLVQEGVEEAVAGFVAVGKAGFQAVAQGHQFIDLGDDAVLFGEGWEGKSKFRPNFTLFRIAIVVRADCRSTRLF